MEEKIEFINADGLKLSGILTKPKKDTKKCIILCHGISSDKNEEGTFVNLAEELNTAGFAVFRFDFRGHGKSEGNSVYMTVTGEKRDLESAVQLVLDRNYSDIGILAASFAGGALSLFAGQYPTLAKAFVLWNCILHYENRLKNPDTEFTKKYWGPDAVARAEKEGYTEIGESKFKVGIALLNEMSILEPLKDLQKAKVPMLFVHGSNDSSVNPQESGKNAKQVKNGEVKIIEGAEHGFHEKKAEKEAIDTTVEFFEKNV